MKYLFIRFCFLFFITTHVYGKKVDKQTARQVAAGFFSTYPGRKIVTNDSLLQLVYVASSAINRSYNGQQEVYFYIFNQAVNDGFVIVAGDDNIQPILAYSHEKDFNAEKIPEHVAQWLENYKMEIASFIRADLPAPYEMRRKWQQLKTGTRLNEAFITTSSIHPLVKTKWNQSPYYNAFCPADAVSGCVATAMAQLMKYWNYPLTGRGAHSYNHDQYGTLSADFGITSYRWSEMPSTINRSNNAIATLMYHCGVAVEMDYSPNSSNAYLVSSSDPVSAEQALKKYFGYSDSLKGIRRDEYTSTSWTALIKSELDAQRPVLYGGFGNSGGHCFIADGYDENDYFHFNWGWGGNYDGYFLLSALNPAGVGTGGGNGNYNSGHQALIGVQPAWERNPAHDISLRLHKEIAASSAQVNYGDSFRISTNILNEGSRDFNGDFCAAIFNDEHVFIDYMEIKNAYHIKAGDTCLNDLQFTHKGLLTLRPGRYYARVYYRNGDEKWVQVPGKGTKLDSVPVEIIQRARISLQAAIRIVQGKRLKTGAAASVQMNLVNKSSTVFKGEYQVALHDITGKVIQAIAGMTEEGLDPGEHHKQPYLLFETSKITVPAGAYFLAVSYKERGGAKWHFAGAGNFENPVTVLVEQATLVADRYETNNAVQQAYRLPVNFSNNIAKLHTDSSGCHVEGDEDYYKVELPPGNNYTIHAKVLDAYGTANGEKFSLDAVLSSSTDGVQWSSPYDNAMKELEVKGGGIVFFHVAAYQHGKTGTYALDLSITRSVITGIEAVDKPGATRVYPNPATEMVYISHAQGGAIWRSVELYNLHGQLLFKRKVNSNELVIKIPLRGYPAGTYLLQLSSAEGRITRKLVISR